MKDRKKLQHIHSSIADKQPTPQSLEVGEIAVNNAKDKEFISLKNTADKVVRFSSDEQLITWIEKKEVMPYSGTVDNVHLDTNRSNIEIKLNQVAAKNTAMYNLVNGAKDIDGQDVNPSDDGGLTNGAGFAIDMSRYAMIGANPSFSSLTVTDKTDLSGNTTISNGDGTGTRTGHTLTINTTDVNSTNTNWTETITNKKSTVTTEEDKIGTLNESATTRTTVIGTENLTVSGTTTEVKNGAVTETNNDTTTITRVKAVTIANNAAKTETTTDNNVVNNKSDYTVNTSGNTNLSTSGNTTVESYGADKAVKIESRGNGGDVQVYAKDNLDVSANTITVKSASNTDVNVGGNLTEKVTESTNVTVSGSTTIKSKDGTTIQTTSGNTNINTTGDTDITSTGDATIQSNGANKSVTVQSTGNGGDVNIYAKDVLTETANTIVVNAATSVSAKTPTTYVSGTTLEVKESNINLSAATGTNISGGTFTSTSTGNTTLNASGDTNINTSGSTTLTTTGNTTIQSTASGSNVNIYAGSAGTANITAQTINQNSTSAITKTSSAYSSANTAVTVVGTADTTVTSAKTVIGTSNVSATTATLSGSTLNVKEANGLTYSGGTLNSTTTGNTTIQATDGTAGDINIYAGDSLTESGKTVTINGSSSITETSPSTTIIGSTTLNMSGATITESGSTTNIYGANKLNMTGTTVTISGSSKLIEKAPSIEISGNTVDISGTTRLSGNTTIGGLTTINNDLNVTNNTNITGATNISGTTTIDDNLNVTGNANITGTTTLKDVTANTISASSISASTINVPGGLTKKLTWSLGRPSSDSVGYNASADKNIVVPSNIEDLRNWSSSSSTLNITGSIAVTDKVQAANGFFQTSDLRFKKNVQDVDFDTALKARNLPIKQFNYTDDPSDRLVYGVIAQEAENSDLNEIVYTDENGKKSVDYTSLLLLKIAYLEKQVDSLRNVLGDLDGKLKKLNDKVQ